MAPVLSIVFIADCAMLLSAPALIGVGIALNAALWIIAAVSWKMSQPLLFPDRVHGLSDLRGAHRVVRDGAPNAAADLQQTNADLLATRSLLEDPRVMPNACGSRASCTMSPVTNSPR